MSDVVENECQTHKGWRGETECVYCLQSRLDRIAALSDAAIKQLASLKGSSVVLVEIREIARGKLK